MIHTAQLIYHIQSYSEYQECKTKLKGLHYIESKNQITLDKRITTHYKDKGISYIELKTIQPTNTFIKRFMIMRININTILETKEYIPLLNEKQRTLLIQNLNILLINMGLPLYNCWRYNRIDYCLNVNTEHVELYLHVLHKGDKPRNTAYPLNEYNHRQSFEKYGSLYLVGADRRLKDMNITVNCYNKHRKVLNTAPEDTAKLNKAKNILRLEIQCHRKKIYTFKSSFGIENNGENYLSWFIFWKIFRYYFGIICLSGKYYKRDILINKIKNDDRISKKNKELMIDFAKQLSIQHKTLWKLKDEYFEYNKAINLFKKYKYNPITLPRNSKVKSLENINDIVYRELKNNASITQYEQALYMYTEDNKYGDNLRNFIDEFIVSYCIGDVV